MTDAWLMEAPCVHGYVWFECPECLREIDEYFSGESEDGYVGSEEIW